MSYNIIEKSSKNLIEGINFIYFNYPFYDPEKFIDLNSSHRYSIEMILHSIEKFVPTDDFLNMILFDYLIGNSDRHQSNWAVISEGTAMEWSPLYDNSSSLCAYIQDNQIDHYLGKDKKRWQALVDTKSKSLIRRTVTEEKRPTHLEVLNYLKNNYYAKTCDLAEAAISVLTKETLQDILNYYIGPDSELNLSDKKGALIHKFLSCKIDMMREVYFERRS